MEQIPITQSKMWQKLQEDLNETAFFEKNDDFQYLAIKKSTPLGNYLYLPYGPVFNDQKGLKSALESLTKLEKDQDTFFIRVEPQNTLFLKNLPKNTTKTIDLNPKETWQLDLTGKDEELTSKLPSRLLRYYKTAEKKGIIIRKSEDPDDIKYLINLQRALAKEKGISTFSEDYLKTELKQPFATLYLVEYQNPDEPNSKKEVIAAGLVFDDEITRYNLQGAQNETGRKLHATGILTIELIKDAKAKKLKIFDFWGIAPEGAPNNHPWAGFTNFKKTFMGEEVQYSGTYDIISKPWKYRLYKVLRTLARTVK